MSRVLTGALTLCLTALALSQSPPAWQLTEQPDRTQGEPVRLLTTTSTNTYPSLDGSPRHISLQIKCSGLLTSSAIISADSADTFAVKTEATTTLPIRLDGQPALNAAWANLSLHQILIYDLRDLLPSHTHMAIDLPLGTSAPQTLSFDLSHLAATMRDFNCRRRL